jgi:hypothetical protein
LLDYEATTFANSVIASTVAEAILAKVFLQVPLPDLGFRELEAFLELQSEQSEDEFNGGISWI